MMTAGLVKHVWWMLNDANFHHDQQVKIQILSIYLKWCTLYTRWKSHSTCQQAIPKGNLIFQTSIIRVKVLVTLFFYVTSVNIFWWNVFSQNMMWNAITHTHKHTISPRVDVQGMASDYAKQARWQNRCAWGVKQCKSMVVFEDFLFLNSALFGWGEKHATGLCLSTFRITVDHNLRLIDLRAHWKRICLNSIFWKMGKLWKQENGKTMETCTETAKLLWRFVSLWCADLPPKWVEHICEHCVLFSTLHSR